MICSDPLVYPDAEDQSKIVPILTGCVILKRTERSQGLGYWLGIKDKNRDLLINIISL